MTVNWLLTYLVVTIYDIKLIVDSRYIIFTVFYVRTVKGEISLPLAWYPTSITPQADLCLIFWEILAHCERLNLRIHAVIADGMSTNRKFFKLIAGVDSIPIRCAFTAPNPYGRNRPILLCSDPSHLLKVSIEIAFGRT